MELTHQQKKQLVRFVAALAWADNTVKQGEMDYVFKLRERLEMELVDGLNPPARPCFREHR